MTHPVIEKVNRQLEREANGYAYRGYLIRYNALQGRAYISKDGHHIGSAQTPRQAERDVDALVN